MIKGFISSTTVGNIRVEMFRRNHRIRLSVNGHVLPVKFRNEKSAQLYSVSQIMREINVDKT